MSDTPGYKLIHAVDPTKIKVQIKEKFAKLTLSNTKKKTEAKEHNDNCQLEKQQSASRNLMDLLDDNAESGETAGGPDRPINLLLRTDSSSMATTSNEEKVPNDDDTMLNSLDENAWKSKCGKNISMNSVSMEPLQVTDDFITQDHAQDQNVINLTKKISSMVVSRQSSEASSTVAEIKSVSNAPFTVAVKEEHSIYVSSTSEEHSSVCESDGAITITDSSLSSIGNANIEVDLITSNIVRSGETMDGFLPSTFSNDKADRMEAFLRDVSQERRGLEQNMPVQIAEIAGNDDIAYADTESMSLSQQWILPKEVLDEDINTTAGAYSQRLPNSHKQSMCLSKQEVFSKEDDNAKKAALAQRLTTADTESMSISMKLVDQVASASPERMHRLLALGDTASMSQSLTPHHFTNDQNVKDKHKCLAFNDTEPNTFIGSKSDTFNNSHEAANDVSSTIDSSHDATHLPKDSLIIPETSSETDDGSLPDKEIQLSEPVSEYSNSTVSTPTQSQLQLGVINISAKINIKIHVSQQAVSEEEEEDENVEEEDNSVSPQESDVLQDDIASTDQRPQRTNADSSLAIEVCQQQKQAIRDVDPTTRRQSQHIPNEEDVIEDPDEFMSEAEKVLNQLYGKTWQTPKVIRTLQRVSGSSGKKSTTTTKKPVEHAPNKTAVSPTANTEESMLDDFSLFRRRIVKTNLDSTRLATPQKQERRRNVEVASESKRDASKKTACGVLAVPQTEVKKRAINTRSRLVGDYWRVLADEVSESDGDNASDDDEADRTEKDFSGDDSASVHSWSDESKNKENNSDSSSHDGQPTVSGTTKKRGKAKLNKSRSNLVYLDLSKHEVTVLEGTPNTAPVNDDVNFQARLQDILRTCRAETRPKLESTPTATTKRKLFTPNIGYEDEVEQNEILRTPDASRDKLRGAVLEDETILHEFKDINIGSNGPLRLDIVNKQLESIKTGKPIFQILPRANRATPKRAFETHKTKTPSNVEDAYRTPQTTQTKTKGRCLDDLRATPVHKFSFLGSLDISVSKCFCHPDALPFRYNYRAKREELTEILYDLYNQQLFDNALNVPLKWNKKLLNTAGRCLNKKRLGQRSSVVELSEKVLTSPDRLRCTLIHELCHAATWIFDGEGGHGAIWKKWAYKANNVFPELPKIGVCHQYDIEYKYTYKCTLCAAKSHAHSKSKKVENIRCAYCHGAIEVFLNKKNKNGDIMPTPVREPTGFAKFVKDNYKQYKKPDLKHADIMKILSNEFAALKVGQH